VEVDETTVKSKDFCAARFDALVKQWNNCTNIDGGYVEV
jgi:hypothetical protein